MKLVKTQVILFMYEKLIMERKLDSSLVKEMFELENKTFYRYIEEIKAYLSNSYKDDEIYYSRADKVYYLVKK